MILAEWPYSIHKVHIASFVAIATIFMNAVFSLPSAAACASVKTSEVPVANNSGLLYVLYYHQQ